MWEPEVGFHIYLKVSIGSHCENRDENRVENRVSIWEPPNTGAYIYWYFLIIYKFFKKKLCTRLLLVKGREDHCKWLQDNKVKPKELC
jgi:hypothetical protein